MVSLPELFRIRTDQLQVLGRVIHIGVDAILVSTVLAGIKRSTGLQYYPLQPHSNTPDSKMKVSKVKKSVAR
jgi:hypothetical protein